MSKNPSGVLTRGPQEWGSKARKEEDRLRGIRSRAEREVIADQLADDDMAAFEADLYDTEADWSVFEDLWP